MMDKRWVLAVEVSKGLGHLTKHGHLEVQGKLLLAVTLQVPTETGVHLLHNKDG